MSMILGKPLSSATWILAALVVAGLAGPASADTFGARAGWVHTDTGLQDDGDGLWAGLEGLRALGTGPLDLGYGLAYLQKKGSVRMVFSDPVEGNRLAGATVTLHTLRAGATLGVHTDLGRLGLRMWSGAAADLKVSEAWDQPRGSTGRRYGYNDLDLVAFVGLDLESGAWTLTLARDMGLREMVLVDGVLLPGKGAAATDPLDGATLPGRGGKVSSWRLGLGYRFDLSGH